MKNLIIFVALAIFSLSCEKDDFDIDNPDVEQFVQQIKNGTYNNYALGENGEKLWAIMPAFEKKHIPLLIQFAEDTSIVSPCGHFPVNPASSIPAYRVSENKASIMIGEYLLWCLQGIIEEKDFASLTPILLDLNSRVEKRLSGGEILEVRTHYQDWWEKYRQAHYTEELPLDRTTYIWR